MVSEFPVHGKLVSLFLSQQQGRNMAERQDGENLMVVRKQRKREEKPERRGPGLDIPFKCMFTMN